MNSSPSLKRTINEANKRRKLCFPSFPFLLHLIFFPKIHFWSQAAEQASSNNNKQSKSKRERREGKENRDDAITL
jgi:hypothetical protein